MARIAEHVVIDNVTFSHRGRDGHHLVFNKLNLSIHRSEVVTIVGPSGSGKTTLAHLLASYITPTDGKILVDRITHKAPGKHCIVISQESDIFGWLTVRQSLELVSKDKEQIDKYLKLVSLDTVAERWGKDLSGGMKKRLSFARALCSGAKLLIFDESFSSLDHTLRHRLYKELLTIAKKERKTVVVITHDIDEAVRLSDRIIILSPRTKNVKSVITLGDDKKRKADNFLVSPQGQKILRSIYNEME